MSLFDGIQDAELFERGKFLSGKCEACKGKGVDSEGKICQACEGIGKFRGVLEVKRTIAKETVRSGIGFIVEFEIVESNMRTAHPVGSKCTWFQKMSDKTVAFPAIKAWAAAVAGYQVHEREAIEADVSPMLEKTLTHATDNPADNDFVGVLVRVETEMIKTRNDKDFTRHDWQPYDEQEPEPQDAVDDMRVEG